MTILKGLQEFAMNMTENFSVKVDAQPEDQLKPAVIDLLKLVGQESGKKILVRTEARHSEIHGRPDLGVAIDKLLAGFIELKAPGLGSNPDKLKGDQSKKQWENFKRIPNLIYTDGNEWSLFRTGEQIGKTVRLDGDVTRDGIEAVSAENAERLEALLYVFLTWEPMVPHNPRELAKYLAPLTRFLRQEVELALEDDRSNLAILHGEWRNYLFPDLDKHQFADAYAQTLTYALLLAQISGAEDLSPDVAAAVLDKGNSLLATTLKILAQKEALQEVSVGYDILIRSLGALKPAQILQRAPELWLYFYEDFLAEYDKKLRNDYGVYYTPVEVVQCQIRFVSELLRERFGKKLSFADDGVTFLDPAVGTGTYLVSAIQHALGLVRTRSGPGAVAGRATSLANNMYAFEFLVGAYAVAHLRLTQEILAEGGSLPDGRLQIYLADTLESPFTTPPGALDLAHKPLVEERRRARAVKERQDILVCLGNPPYHRGESEQEKGGWVRYGDEGQDRPILEDFLEPARNAGKGGDLKNLYNDYVYFWRWALWKLFEHQRTGGIISFINASSYLGGPAFVGMREVMRRTFDELWIINLEGGNLGARKTENVFSIQTPVAIAIGICKREPDRDAPAIVHYAKIIGTREDKLATLNALEDFSGLKWQDCPTGWQEKFFPAVQGIFNTWPVITDIFPWQHSGSQWKRRWPIGETPDVLKDRWKRFLSLDREKRREAFYETRDRTIDKTYSNSLPGSAAPSLGDLDANASFPSIQRYAFRSFDRHWALFDTRLGDYLRPALVGTQSNKQVYLTSLLTEAIAHGPSATVSSAIPDLHYFSGRGARDIVPLWRDAGATQANITNGLLSALSKTLKQDVSAEALFAYCYAVLANPGYVNRFWEELANPGPRIPITKKRALFDKAVEVGRRLVWLHTYGERMIPGGKALGDIPVGKAKSLKSIPSGEADYPQDYCYDPVMKEVHFGAGRFGPVMPEIWEFEVSGLKVVQSWLAYRRKSGAGKQSSPLDKIRPRQWTAAMTDEFLELLWILEHTVATFPDLQKLLEKIVSAPCFLATELPQPATAERESPKTEEEHEDDPNEAQGKLL